jgi:hypothetical protein
MSKTMKLLEILPITWLVGWKPIRQNTGAYATEGTNGSLEVGTRLRLSFPGQQSL